MNSGNGPAAEGRSGCTNVRGQSVIRSSVAAVFAVVMLLAGAAIGSADEPNPPFDHIPVVSILGTAKVGVTLLAQRRLRIPCHCLTTPSSSGSSATLSRARTTPTPSSPATSARRFCFASRSARRACQDAVIRIRAYRRGRTRHPGIHANDLGRCGRGLHPEGHGPPSGRHLHLPMEAQRFVDLRCKVVHLQADVL